MMQRRTFRIGEIGRVVTGKTPSTAAPENFGSDFPFLTPTDMHGTKWARSTERGLSVTGAGKLRCNVPAGAVAVSCIGWQMGKSILIDRPTYTNQQINTIIPNDHASAEYLYYYLATRREELLSIGAAGGVRTPIISKSAFEAIEIALPDLPVQRRIASILSAYDDLIENNTRRIAILEEMARRIYEEWFVRFRFPGHEQVKMVESELGLIPEGWSIATLGDVVRKSGRKFVEASDAMLPLVDLARIPRRSSALSDIGRSNEITTSRIVFEKNQILFGAIRPNFHKVLLAPFDGVTNVSVHVFEPKLQDSLSFSHALLFSDRTVAWTVQHSGGMKMPTINWDVMQKMPVIVPTLNLLNVFEKQVQPMLGLMMVLVRKNFPLRATRDLLLPKLISGELDVSTLPEPEEAIAA